MKFTPEDFREFTLIGSLDAGGPRDQKISANGRMFAKAASEIANAKLAEWLEKAPVIRKEWESYKWVEEALEDKFITHKARLVCIEEIK